MKGRQTIKYKIMARLNYACNLYTLKRFGYGISFEGESIGAKGLPEQVINVKNSDRMVFVLRRADKNVGIASIIIYFLGQLNYMQRTYPKAVPYIDMANYEQSICEKEGNAWEYFFEQIEGEKYYIDSNSNRILSNGGDGKFYYNLPLIYDYNVLMKKDGRDYLMTIS